MMRNWCACAAACAFVLAAGVSRAQSREPSDAWLMKNYRFTGPPKPGSIPPTDPVVSDLRQIQNMLLSIMRKADFGEDYETAMAAAAQAASNAQLIGVINQRIEAAANAQKAAVEAKANTPTYSIAFTDHTIETATAYWSDGLMLHYMTPQGAHVQVRLNHVDKSLSAKLNRMNHLDFNLPE